MEKVNGKRRLCRITCRLVLAATVMMSSSALAQNWDDDYEYEADEGLHQEEWYDPSDWFDTGEGINYETDWNDYYYGYDAYDNWGYEPYQSGYYDVVDDPFDPYDPYYPYNPLYNDIYDYDYYSENWHEDNQ